MANTKDHWTEPLVNKYLLELDQFKIERREKNNKYDMVGISQEDNLSIKILRESFWEINTTFKYFYKKLPSLFSCCEI